MYVNYFHAAHSRLTDEAWICTNTSASSHVLVNRYGRRKLAMANLKLGSGRLGGENGEVRSCWESMSSLSLYIQAQKLVGSGRLRLANTARWRWAHSGF